MIVLRGHRFSPDPHRPAYLRCELCGDSFYRVLADRYDRPCANPPADNFHIHAKENHALPDHHDQDA
jgi:hypothetical protein